MTETNTYDLQMGWETFDVGEERGREETSGFAKGHIGEKITISEALVMSLRKHMDVDIHFISEVTGKDKDTVIDLLKGVIYQNPET